MIVQAIEFLKGYQIADKITSRTTHLVCGEARRTLSLVCAIAHGMKLAHVFGVWVSGVWAVIRGGVYTVRAFVH